MNHLKYILLGLAFTIGGGCFGSGPRNCQSLARASGRKSATDKKTLTFRLTVLGDTRSDTGTLMSVEGFEASDGTKLSVVSGEFRSAAAAKGQLEKEIARASRVLKRERKKDNAGRVVGYRAEAIIKAGASGTLPAVLWTNGLWFHEITSSSLPDARALEKRYTY